MINVSTEFKRALANDQRNYIERAVITLIDGTALELSNSDIWDGGFSIEDAVSSDSSFDIGATIINKASLVINNIYDDFSEYDFNGATVVFYIGLDLNGTEEVFKKGTFIVDEAAYDGEVIRLSCLDYMSKFDIPYSNSKLGYPATLDQIVRNACSVCDVSLNTYDFPHKNYTVQIKPTEESTTFREVISYAAQIAGCFARCNVNGALELKWFDQSSLEQQYSMLDGGYFDGGKSGFSRLSAYFNTTDGMTAIVDGSRKDDQTFALDGVDWFTFDGNVASTIYVNSNSWVNFGKTPSSSGSTSTGQLNILRRDGQMHYLYRQEGRVGGLDFLKIRFEGYTQYSSSSAVPAYANRWELFIISDGDMVINMLQTPTVATYIGTSTLVTESQTLQLSLADGKGSAPIIGLTLSGGTWSESSTKYLSGDIADGGSFNPWNAGYTADSNSFDAQAAVHSLYSIYGMTVTTDNVVITGVRISVKIKDKSNKDAVKSYMRGTDGYVIGIEDNPFITTGTAQSIADWLGMQLIGFRFRKATVQHSSDPTIEAGDVAILFDRKNRSYPFVVSETKFSIGSSQTTSAHAETPAKNSAARFSAETKNYIALRDQIVDEKTDRELALEELTARLNETSQMYITKQTSGGNLSAIIIHNKKNLSDSDIIWKITTNAFGVSTDGGKTYNLGATADGDLITRVLTTIGVNADWINAGHISANRISGGTLTLGGSNNINGTLKILNSSGSQIGKWDKDGITASSGSFSGTITSSSGTIGGFTIGGSKLYKNKSTLTSSTSGVYVGTDGISLGSGSTFKVTSAGALTAENATIKGSMRTGGGGSYVSIGSDGLIRGGVGSSQYGYIEYNASVYNMDTGATNRGIQIQGGTLRISTNSISVARSSSTSTTTLIGGTGTMRYIESIRALSGGDIEWTSSSVRFINGIMVTSF